MGTLSGRSQGVLRSRGESVSHEHLDVARGIPVAAPPLRPPAPTRPFGWSSGAWIVNGVLVLALVALGAYAYTRLTASSSTSAATRTATVQRGVVTTSVSASGSVASAGDVAANFQTGGTLTALLVKQGQHVSKGHVLARIDSLSARQAVQEAEAVSATAQGRLQQTLNPLNAQEKAQLALSDAAAAQSVQAATVSLSDTRAQNAQNLSQAQTAVTRAKQQLASDQAQLATDKKSTAATAQSAISQDEDKVSSDETAVQTAVANVAATKLKNTQSLHSAESQVAQAKTQQQTNAAGNAVKTAPPKPGDLASAKAAVVQAQIALAQARKALRETTLRAPISGVVATVNGSVGDSVSGGSSNASSASSSSSSSSASSSTGSSFVVQLELRHDHGPEQAPGRGRVQRGRRGLDQGGRAGDRHDQRATGSRARREGDRDRLHGDDRLQCRDLQRDVRADRHQRQAQARHDGRRRRHHRRARQRAARADQRGHRQRGERPRDGAAQRRQVSTPVVAGLKGDDATEITSGLRAGDTVVLPTLTLATRARARPPWARGGRPLEGGGGRLRRRRVRRALSAWRRRSSPSITSGRPTARATRRCTRCAT